MVTKDTNDIDLPFNLNYAGLTDIGSVRDNNEDCWSADPEFGCYIVSDGMGGALAGEVASDIVAHQLPDILKKYIPLELDEISNEAVCNDLFKGLTEVNDIVCKRSAEDPECQGMGATLVMLMIRGPQVMVVHAGDSRAYLLRDNQISCLTNDHNMLQVLLDEGSVTPEEAIGHPAGCELLCDVGMPEGMYADVIYYDMVHGDKILLCSDGLNGMVRDEEIEHIMNKNNTPEVICQELIQAAIHGGGQDNVTALVIDCV